MKLYDGNGKYTDEAFGLENEILPVVKQTFVDYIARGYSVREISHIMMGVIYDLELEAIIDSSLTDPITERE